MKIKTIGTLLILLSVAFVNIETAYFLSVYGWHFSSACQAERVCDDVAFTMFVAGIVLFFHNENTRGNL